MFAVREREEYSTTRAAGCEHAKDVGKALCFNVIFGVKEERENGFKSGKTEQSAP